MYKFKNCHRGENRFSNVQPILIVHLKLIYLSDLFMIKTHKVYLLLMNKMTSVSNVHESSEHLKCKNNN